MILFSGIGQSYVYLTALWQPEKDFPQWPSAAKLRLAGCQSLKDESMNAASCIYTSAIQSSALYSFGCWSMNSAKVWTGSWLRERDSLFILWQCSKFGSHCLNVHAVEYIRFYAPLFFLGQGTLTSSSLFSKWCSLSTIPGYNIISITVPSSFSLD